MKHLPDNSDDRLDSESGLWSLLLGFFWLVLFVISCLFPSFPLLPSLLSCFRGAWHDIRRGHSHQRHHSPDGQFQEDNRSEQEVNRGRGRLAHQPPQGKTEETKYLIVASWEGHSLVRLMLGYKAKLLFMWALNVKEWMNLRDGCVAPFCLCSISLLLYYYYKKLSLLLAISTTVDILLSFILPWAEAVKGRWASQELKKGETAEDIFPGESIYFPIGWFQFQLTLCLVSNFQFTDLLIYASAIPPANTTFRVIKRIPLSGMKVWLINCNKMYACRMFCDCFHG